MPIVPRYGGPQIEEQLAPNARQTAAPAADIAAGGQALARGLGQAADVAGDMYRREKAKIDSSAVLEARRKLLDWEQSNFDDPQNPNALYNNKGRSSIEAGDKLTGEYTKYRDQVVASLADDDQRQMFEPFAMQHEFSLRDRRNSYVRREVDQATQAEFKASTASSIETYGRSAGLGDTNRMQAEMNAGVAGLRMYGQQQGWSAREMEYFENEYRSKAHGAAMQSLIDSGDYNAAREYFDANDEDMQADERTRYAAVVNKIREEEEVDGVVARLDTGGPLSSAEAVWQRMVKQESGGRQFGKDGKPLTSSAGAVGIAQVMPETAQEVARKNGIAWDEGRYKTDAEYNMKLGKLYYDEQVRKYKDPMLAAAAYNAGPGAVDKWLAKYGDPRKGEISPEEFASKIPFSETREYVARTALGGERAPTYSDKIRAIDADPLLTSEQRRMAKAKVREQKSMEEFEESQAKGDVAESISRHLVTGGTMTNLPPDLRARAEVVAPDILLQFQRSADTGGGATKTDQRRWSELAQMAAEKPYEFAKLDLRHDLPKLSDSDFQELSKMQTGIKAGKETKAAQSLRVQTAVAKPLLVQAGLAVQKGQSITWKKGKEDEGAAFYRALNDEVKSFRDRTGKEPGPDDVQALADKLLIRSTYTIEDGGVAWFDSEGEAFAFDLPAAARSKLKEGVTTRFQNGQAWTLKNGNPTRIK